MSIKSLMNYTFVSKYARWIPEKKRRETWAEAVDRVKEMMLDKYVDLDPSGQIVEFEKQLQIQKDIEWAYEQMLKKRVLGSQRALQFGGDPILKHNARIYNCIASYADRLNFFQECMFLLLCGCGTGFSVQQHHIAKLPRLIKQKSGSKSLPSQIQLKDGQTRLAFWCLVTLIKTNSFPNTMERMSTLTTL